MLYYPFRTEVHMPWHTADVTTDGVVHRLSKNITTDKNSKTSAYDQWASQFSTWSSLLGTLAQRIPLYLAMSGINRALFMGVHKSFLHIGLQTKSFPLMGVSMTVGALNAIGMTGLNYALSDETTRQTTNWGSQLVQSLLFAVTASAIGVGVKQGLNLGNTTNIPTNLAGTNSNLTSLYNVASIFGNGLRIETAQLFGAVVLGELLENVFNEHHLQMTLSERIRMEAVEGLLGVGLGHGVMRVMDDLRPNQYKPRLYVTEEPEDLATRLARINDDDIFDAVAADPTHPGANDAAYRQRRIDIAERAKEFWRLVADPDSEYSINYLPPRPDDGFTELDHQTWAKIQKKLRPVQDAHLSKDMLAAREQMRGSLEHRGIDMDQQVPPMQIMNDILEGRNHGNGFRIAPISGLIEVRLFFSAMAERIFLSTGYLRHHSKPDFTPEPDRSHEDGHAINLIDERMAQLATLFGKIAKVASDAEIQMLDRLWWRTMEYGVVWEGNRIKGYAAGPIGESGGLVNMNRGHPDLVTPWGRVQQMLVSAIHFATGQQNHNITMYMDLAIALKTVGITINPESKIARALSLRNTPPSIKPFGQALFSQDYQVHGMQRTFFADTDLDRVYKRLSHYLDAWRTRILETRRQDLERTQGSFV